MFHDSFQTYTSSYTIYLHMHTLIHTHIHTYPTHKIQIAVCEVNW